MHAAAPAQRTSSEISAPILAMAMTRDLEGVRREVVVWVRCRVRMLWVAWRVVGREVETLGWGLV